MQRNFLLDVRHVVCFDFPAITTREYIWHFRWMKCMATIVCDYMETALFAIVCDPGLSAIVCDHMELPSLWPKSPDKVLILQNLIWQDSLVSDQFKTSSIGLFGTLYNYPPKGRWIVVDIYRDAKRRGIYPPLFTDPEGDSCFSIYQIRWIKKCCFNFSSETTRHFSLRSQNSEIRGIFHGTIWIFHCIKFDVWNQVELTKRDCSKTFETTETKRYLLMTALSG